MEDAAKAELVRKAMRDAGLDDDTVSAFDEHLLLKQHGKGYKASMSFKCPRDQDLRECGIPLQLIGILLQGERLSSYFPLKVIMYDY